MSPDGDSPSRKPGDKGDFTRRRFLQTAGLAGLALGSGALGPLPRRAMAKSAAPNKPYNLLFILTDQERFPHPVVTPKDFIASLPARARLRREGVSFVNHHIAAAVCSSSRSVIYTGQHIPHTKIFDNLDSPWQKDLSHDIPTVGDMLGQAGYHAAYLGKWHLSKGLGTKNEYAVPSIKLTQDMESYGFRDYVGIGDVIDSTMGGYLNDNLIGAQAGRWLRLRAQALNQAGTPWYLAVNLVNPHDVMFFDTDLPGEHVQDTPKPMMEITRGPKETQFAKQWRFPLPSTRNQPFSQPGRPRAHLDYQLARGALVGDFPSQDGRWTRLLNYYFNCIQFTDVIIGRLLSLLDELGLAENTIVVHTADHGELGGAHQTHGKGTTAYREQNHVPLVISHPAYPATRGQQCRALTSHVDLATTLLAWTGAASKLPAAVTKPLPGRDLTPLLAAGEKAPLHAVRPATLYCFDMLMYLDSNFTRELQIYKNSGGDESKLGGMAFKIDLNKRGAIRSVFDGRYKFSRYFSPLNFNTPTSLTGLRDNNDVELYDLEADPAEAHNLAARPQENSKLMMAMNQKLSEIIAQEVGKDGAWTPPGGTLPGAPRLDP